MLPTLIGFVSSAREFRRVPTAGLYDIAQNTGYLFNDLADIIGVRDGTLLSVDGGGTASPFHNGTPAPSPLTQ